MNFKQAFSFIAADFGAGIFNCNGQFVIKAAGRPAAFIGNLAKLSGDMITKQSLAIVKRMSFLLGNSGLLIRNSGDSGDLAENAITRFSENGKNCNRPAMGARGLLHHLTLGMVEHCWTPCDWLFNYYSVLSNYSKARLSHNSVTPQLRKCNQFCINNSYIVYTKRVCQKQRTFLGLSKGKREWALTPFIKVRLLESGLAVPGHLEG